MPFLGCANARKIEGYTTEDVLHSLMYWVVWSFFAGIFSYILGYYITTSLSTKAVSHLNQQHEYLQQLAFESQDAAYSLQGKIKLSQLDIQSKQQQITQLTHQQGQQQGFPPRIIDNRYQISFLTYEMDSLQKQANDLDTYLKKIQAEADNARAQAELKQQEEEQLKDHVSMFFAVVVALILIFVLVVILLVSLAVMYFHKDEKKGRSAKWMVGWSFLAVLAVLFAMLIYLKFNVNEAVKSTRELIGTAADSHTAPNVDSYSHE